MKNDKSNKNYYRNPILYGDYSDPDVIRAGSDFYMVSSTFTYMPGIPLLHSKDLVHWKVVNYILKKLPFEVYDVPAHGKGAWAPSIRFRNNKFYVYFSTPDEGIFVSTASDPLKEWTPPILVKAAKGWIDPCPFWDEDGKAYLVHAFAQSRAGIKHILYMHRMSDDGTGLLDEGKLIFDGTLSHPTLEGPKMYKRNGYYYILAPAGGVSTGWQVALRSKDIYGPYEDKIVLHQGNTGVNGPHQGGLVELEGGESWFIHFQDCGAYGRIPHLQPVKWVSDWPLIGVDINEDRIGEPVSIYKVPEVGADFPREYPDTSDEFNSGKLGLQWQWQANPKEEWYSLTENPGFLRLYVCKLPCICGNNLYNASNFISQLFQAFEFAATIKVTLNTQNCNDRAGLAIMGNSYGYIYMSKKNGDTFVCQVIGNVDENEITEKEVEVKKVKGNTIYFRVSVIQNLICSFSFSTDGESFERIGEKLKGEAGKWVGARLGLFSVNFNNETSSGYADFDWIHIE